MLTQLCLDDDIDQVDDNLRSPDPHSWWGHTKPLRYLTEWLLKSPDSHAWLKERWIIRGYYVFVRLYHVLQIKIRVYTLLLYMVI